MTYICIHKRKYLSTTYIVNTLNSKIESIPLDDMKPMNVDLESTVYTYIIKDLVKHNYTIYRILHGIKRDMITFFNYQLVITRSFTWGDDG